MLSSDQINSIEAIAADILKDALEVSSLDELYPPIDLKRIIDHYGLELRSGDFSDQELAGVFDRQEKAIYISNSEANQRKAFTIAHELGHYFLHEDTELEIFYRKNIITLQDGTVEELEATWFAVCLLMPKNLFHKTYTTLNNIEQAAEIFGVPSSAAYFRAKYLGLTS